MLNRQQYIERLNKACECMGFDKRQVTIIYGGASLMHNLRPHTADVDVSIKKDYWDLLVENGNEVKVLPAKDGLPELEAIEFMDVDFFLERKNIDDRDKMIFHGYATVKPLRLLRDRIAYGREKDIPDIYKLKQYHRFLTSCEESQMWSVCRAHRGTATF